jgi:hypothetical protein
MNRWIGLAELVRDAVHHGSIAVERVHQRVARRPLEIVAWVPPLGRAALGFAALQGRLIGATYAAIRGVNGVVGAVVVTALDAAAHEPPRGGVAQRPGRH